MLDSLGFSGATNYLFDTLTEADSMTPGQPWQGPVKITARVDKDGNANPLSDGDLWGEGEKSVSQAEKVSILIDKEFTSH